jgi:hypothetical protein
VFLLEVYLLVFDKSLWYLKVYDNVDTGANKLA